MLEEIINKGKEIGKGIKNHGLKIGASLLLPFAFAGNVNADTPGYLVLKNNLNDSQRHVNITRDDNAYPGAKDDYDEGYDSGAIPNPLDTTQCYSDVNDSNFHLWSDVRAEDSNVPYDIKFAYEGYLDSDKENIVSFEFLGDPENYQFGNKPIIFQQTSSAMDPNGTDGFYPVYDVRKAIDKNDGEVPLKEVPAGDYDQWSPYGGGILEIGTRLLSDLDESGNVNFKDFAYLSEDWMNHDDVNGVPYSIANISGPNGIPDFNSVSGKAIVDVYDLKAFSDDWLRSVE